MRPFFMYILKCWDASYYVGHTDDLDARLAQHVSGGADGYTAKRLPVELAYAAEFPTRREAFEAERRIKGWTRAKKEALMRGDWERVRLLARRGTRASSQERG